MNPSSEDLLAIDRTNGFHDGEQDEASGKVDMSVLDQSLASDLDAVHKGMLADFPKVFEHMKNEQLKIEEAIRLSQQSVFYQRENAQILSANMAELDQIYTEQQREQKEFEEQLELETQERLKRASLQVQQRALLLELETHQKTIHLLRAQYRKAQAFSRELVRKREAFNLKMEQRRDRQEEESKFLLQAQERQARNQQILVEYVLQKVSASDRAHKNKEQKLVAQHLFDLQRKEADQLRESQNVQTVYLTRVFELDMKIQEERNNLLLTHYAAIQRMTTAQDLEIRKEKDKLKAKKAELDSLAIQDVQRARLQRLQAAQKLTVAKMTRQHKQDALQRERQAKKELDANYEEFLSTLKKPSKLNDEKSEHSDPARSTLSESGKSGLTDDSGLEDQVEAMAAAEDNLDVEEQNKTRKEAQVRIEQQLAVEEQRLAELEQEHSRAFTDLKQRHKQELLSASTRGRDLKREASREMETQLFTLKKSQSTQMQALRKTQARELEAFHILQKRESDLLRAGEEMRVVMGAMKDPMIVSDADGVIEVFNQSACDLFGYIPSEVIGQNVSILSEPEIAKKHKLFIERYHKTGVARIIGTAGREVTGVTKNGERIPLLLSITTSTSSGRRLFIASMHDMRAVKKKELELKKSMDELKAIMAAMVDPMVVSDENGIIEVFNPAAATLFGYSQEQAMGKNVAMLTESSIRAEHQSYIERYKRTGQARVIGTAGREVMGQRSDGRLVPVILSLTAENVNGRRIFIANLHDISKLKKKEQDVKKAMDELAAILGAMKDPMVVSDENGIIELFNPAACTLFGYSREEVIGQNVAIIVDRRIRSMHQQFLNDYNRTGNARIIGTAGREVMGEKKDGTSVEVLLSISVEIVNGRKIFIANLHDITQIKRKEKELAAILSAMKDPMVVANEMGTIELFNPSACQLFGYKKEEVIGQNVAIIVDKRIRDQHQSYIDEYHRTGKGKIIGTAGREVLGERKDGTTVELLLSITAEVVNNRKIIIGNLHDITGLKTKERALELAKTEIFDVMAAMQDPMIVSDDKGTIELFNPSAARLFGYTEEEVLGKNVRMLTEPGIRNQHQSYIDRYNKTGVARVIGVGRDVKGQRKDGTLIPLFLTIAISEVGGRRRFIANLHDLTELQNAADGMKGILAAMGDPIVISDEKGTVELFNPAASRLFGYKTEEVLGKNVAMLVNKKIRKEHQSYIEQYNRTGVGKVIGTAGRQVVGERKDGSAVDILLSITTATINSRKIFIANLHDLTEIKTRKNSGIGKMSALVGAVSDVIAVVDETGKIEAYTPAFTQHFELLPQQDLNAHTLSVCGSGVLAEFTAFIKRRKKGDPTKIANITLAAKPAKQSSPGQQPAPMIRFTITTEPHTDGESYVIKFEGSQGLRMVEASMANLPFPVIATDLKGYVETCNEEWIRMGGLDRTELRGRTLWDLFDGVASKTIKAELQRLTQGPLPRGVLFTVPGEAQLRTPTPIKLAVSHVDVGAGYLFGVVRDPQK